MKLSNRLEFALVDLRRETPGANTKPLEQILRDLLDFEREYDEIEAELNMVELTG